MNIVIKRFLSILLVMLFAFPINSSVSASASFNSPEIVEGINYNKKDESTETQIKKYKSEIAIINEKTSKNLISILCKSFLTAFSLVIDLLMIYYVISKVIHTNNDKNDLEIPTNEDTITTRYNIWNFINGEYVYMKGSAEEFHTGVGDILVAQEMVNRRELLSKFQK